MKHLEARIDPRPSADLPTVAYIVGWGRSGSTILDNLLGQAEGAFSAGELFYLWDRGLLEGRSCGCGKPVRECPIWAAVLDLLAQRIPIPLEQVVQLRDAVLRNRHMGRLLRARSPHVLGEFGPIVKETYRAIREITGARIVIDSSKRLPAAAALTLLKDIDVRFVHLVRDPRAVAHSWAKHTSRGDGAQMRRFSPASSTVRWALWEDTIQRLSHRIPVGKLMTLRYEDFVADPREVTDKVLAFLGLGSDVPLAGRVAHLSTTHTVSGNASRFKTGDIEIKNDDEWMNAQGRLDRAVATTISLPFLHRYGYRVRTGDRDE